MPEVKDIAPPDPVPEFAVLSPAYMVTAPPGFVLPAPPDKTIAPDPPLTAAPDEICMPPLAPSVVEPVAHTTDPDTPVLPPVPDATLINPLDVAVPFPDTSDNDPPVSTDDTPADTEI
jgi:hypothetical protein